MVSTSIASSTYRLAGIACAITLGFGAVTTARAKDIQYTAQQRMACMPDAMRLCAHEIPNVERIRTCMIVHQSSLSTGCRAMFRS